jgi:hypothetical protein
VETSAILATSTIDIVGLVVVVMSPGSALRRALHLIGAQAYPLANLGQRFDDLLRFFMSRSSSARGRITEPKVMRPMLASSQRLETRGERAREPAATI